jgi:hypothetical protein
MARRYAPHRRRPVSPVCQRGASRDVRNWLQATLDEDVIQRTLLDHFEKRCRPGVVIFHIPNGGLRDLITGKKMKALGVKEGMPDLGVVIGSVTHYLELKRIGGVLSEAQERTIADLRAAGAPVEVAYGLDAGIAQLERWGAIQVAAA